MQASLGGLMFWSLEGDDFADKCNKGKYSLLKSAIAAMSNGIEYENKKGVEWEKDVESNNGKKIVRHGSSHMYNVKKIVRHGASHIFSECSESVVDGIPILSQAKSLYEWVWGKSHCAKKTQEDFTRKAPIISQVRSAIEALNGDLEEARQTQITFLKTLGQIVDGTPGLGHAKAAIHCAAGQIEKCKVFKIVYKFF